MKRLTTVKIFMDFSSIKTLFFGGGGVLGTITIRTTIKMAIGKTVTQDGNS